MSNGDEFDYEFKRKDDWRGWAWNRIAERLSRPAKDSICIYLPGAKDLDKAVAIKKGFRAENMIAIECSSLPLRALRANGVLTIRGQFQAAINYLAIKESLPHVDVVFGDFCGGPPVELPTLNNAWVEIPCFTLCVFAFNFLRGRDKWWTQNLRSQPFPYPSKQYLIPELRSFASHRGMQYWYEYLRVMYGRTKSLHEDGALEFVTNRMRLAFSSYRSSAGNMYFDSLVFRSQLAAFGGVELIDRARMRHEAVLEIQKYILDYPVRLFDKRNNPDNVSGSVRATLATRTKQLIPQEPH